MNNLMKTAMVAVVAVMALLFEASHPGPYTSKFNLSKEKQIIENELIGQSAEQAIALLGKPTRIIEKEDGSIYAEYLPYSFLPFSRFQLKIVEGRLDKIRKFIF